MSDDGIPNMAERTAQYLSRLDNRNAGPSGPKTPASPGAKDKTVAVHRVNVPFYDQNLQGRDEEQQMYTLRLESNMQYYLGDESYARCVELANGRGVHPVQMLRDRLWFAMDSGDADAVDAKQKRRREDNDPEHGTQQPLVELLTPALWLKLCDIARARNVTNEAALKAGMALALARHAI